MVANMYLITCIYSTPFWASSALTQGVCILYIVQSNHTYTSTSVLDEIADKVRELDKQRSSSIVYSRIIADLLLKKTTPEGEGITGYLRCRLVRSHCMYTYVYIYNSKLFK